LLAVRRPGEAMDRLFLDANILSSAAYRPQAGLRHLSGVALVTSAYAVEEARINLPDGDPRRRLERLVAAIEVMDCAPPTQPLPPNVDLPDKDRPILLGAIAAHTTHLLTGDLTHFGRYYGQTIEGVLILRPAEYLRSRANL